MLGMTYAMVAVSFMLFFGVLEVIKFSHGDVLTLGGFPALASYGGLQAAAVDNPWALPLLSSVLLYAVVCLGRNVQFGYVGIVNFANAAFFGIGSYAAETLAPHTALHYFLVLIAGGKCLFTPAARCSAC